MLILKLMALPTPSKTFFSNYKAMITRFIWNNKTPRIRYSKLVQKYQNSGLQLVDLEAKNYALKAAWVSRWSKKNRLGKIDWFYENLPIQDTRIWECNIDQRDLKYYCSSSHDMGYHVLKAWSMIHFSSDCSPGTLHFVPIWFNSLIRRVDQPFLDRILIDSNIQTLIDIWDFTTNSFFEYKRLIEIKGEILPYLLYRAIISSIPVSWKLNMRTLKDSSIESLTTKVETATAMEHPSKIYYWDYIDRKIPNSDACAKLWEKDLNLENLFEEWPAIMASIRKITSAAKLRWLHYRVLNRCLTTNLLRSKWDKNLSSQCVFCKSSPETIIHILYDCIHVKKLWTALEKWADYFFGLKMELSKALVILNNYSGPQKQLINTVLLAMKQFIYASKCKEEIPLFLKFPQILDYWERIERTEAILSQKYMKHVKKWKLYINIR